VTDGTDPDVPARAEPGLRRAWLSYLIAVVATLGAFAGKRALFGWGGATYVFFYPTVMLVGLVLGLGPGLTATGLACLLTAAWILPGAAAGRPVGVAEVAELAIFTLSGALTSVLAERHRRASRGTLRLETERTREQTAARYQAIFEVAGVGLCEEDAETGRFLQVNRRLATFLGRPRAELATLGWPEVTHPDELGEDRAAQAALLAGTAEGYTREKRYLRADGATVWGRVSVTRGLPGPDGRATWVASIEDVTERKQAEEALRRADEALRQSEARFRALTERSSDMISIFGADGSVLYWSPSAEEQLGWTTAEVQGRPMTELTHPEDLPEAMDGFAALQAAPGALGRISMRLRHRDGTWRRLQTTARNLLDDPAVRGIVANARDVTAEWGLADQLRQSQKLESVGRLAGGVAHDFNNLLTVILACSSELLRELAEGETPDAEDVREIHAAGQRAADLTRQLLAFARKQVIAPVALDLNEVVGASEKLLRRVLGEDVAVSVSAQPGLWTVMADRGQLEQVLLNLAVNARDAMSGGGALRLRTFNEAIAVDAPVQADRRPGHWVVLAVEDTGAGLAPEAQAHLFEPFFTTKGVGQGTGLGLATVHGVVTQGGGHVRVTSQPGLGTTFEVVLPRWLGAPTPAARTVEAGALRGTETVLVAEDDPQVLAVTARTLGDAGYQVLATTSGPEALARTARHDGPIALLVSDMVMPGMSGRALADALRIRRPDLRVLLLSGYSQEALAGRGLPSAGQGFLAKPFTGNDLLAAVRRTLDAEPPGPVHGPAPALSRFAWPPSLEIGVPEIDTQHRALFAAAARFEGALRAEKPADQLARLFTFLLDYVGQHFEAEERYMASRSVPGLEAHRREHEALRAQLGLVRGQVASGGGLKEIAPAALDLLHGWLTQHVGTTDQALRTRARPAR